MKKPEIPTPEEIARINYYGILFADKTILKYFDLSDKKVYTLDKASGTIYAILAEGEEVYYGEMDEKVRSLFSGFESADKRDYFVEAIQSHKAKILSAGGYGLVSELENKIMISEKEMKKKNIKCINSLPKDSEGNLFGLVKYNDNSCGLVSLPEKSGKYSLGEEILRYDAKHIYICQAIIIRWGKTGKLKGSVLSCVNLKYLDLNNEKIEGTEVGENQSIHRIAPLSLYGNELEVVYSGNNFTKIVKARINLKKKKAETEVLKDGLSWVLALEVVGNKSLHEKLVEKGREVKK